MKSTLSLEYLEDVGSHWSEDHEIESVGSNESFENEPDQDEGLSNVCPENPRRDGKVDLSSPYSAFGKYSDPFPFSTF
jgi:hypothetical protein